MVGERDKAILLAIGQIEKQYGKGAIMRLGDRERTAIDAIPTGSIALDLALGIGGVPRGRVVEIYGPESSGKTTLATHIVAEARGLVDGAIGAYSQNEYFAVDAQQAYGLVGVGASAAGARS